MAEQVKVDPRLFAEYVWPDRTIEYHRAQDREALGFRESTRKDEERLAPSWPRRSTRWSWARSDS
jgi:hypothetical protein